MRGCATTRRRSLAAFKAFLSANAEAERFLFNFLRSLLNLFILFI